MGKNERRPGDPYEVGFGKPPERTRFKKGRSGNPKGRPRKKPDLYSELTKVVQHGSFRDRLRAARLPPN